MPREYPEPNFDYDVNRLAEKYKVAVQDIMTALERMDLTNVSRANMIAVLNQVAGYIADLDKESEAWVKETLPRFALEAVAATLYSLKVADTVEEARKLASFNRMNKYAVDAAIADTHSDLLAVTQNVDRKVRAAVRRVSSEVMRTNYAKGINGRRTNQAQLLSELRQELGKALETGIIDARGRRWKPETYVEMLVRTKGKQIHIEATINEAVQRGAFHGRISRHGAKDGCGLYEGKIVKLVPEAKGDFPYIGDLRRGNVIFHPNCKHSVSPVRTPSEEDYNSSNPDQ